MKKYRVGVQAMTDQTNQEFKRVPLRPRTKLFKNEDKAFSYFEKCKALARTNSYDAFFDEF